MPATSRSQRRLFGYIHAIQAGKVKAPDAKMRHMAKNISPTSVDHFVKTKEKNLPERKKSAGAFASGVFGRERDKPVIGRIRGTEPIDQQGDESIANRQTPPGSHPRNLKKAQLLKAAAHRLLREKRAAANLIKSALFRLVAEKFANVDVAGMGMDAGGAAGTGMAGGMSPGGDGLGSSPGMGAMAPMAPVAPAAMPGTPAAPTMPPASAAGSIL